ncbi:uncharacterized protein [Centruroides vittatus]|uniref:uncharacterized protein n=1 Tax=Centruroides vittatus TaxID=120091 RepID=UPI003510C205
MLMNMDELLDSVLVLKLNSKELQELTEKTLLKVALIDFPHYYRKGRKCFQFPIYTIHYQEWENEFKELFQLVIDHLVPYISVIKTPMFGYSLTKLKVCMFLREGDERIKNLWFEENKKSASAHMNKDFEKYADKVYENLNKVAKYFEKDNSILNCCFTAESVLLDCLPGKIINC